MNIGKAVFEFKSKELKAMVNEVHKDKRRVYRVWSAFARKHGAIDNPMLVGEFQGEYLAGVKFAKTPDPALWRKHPREEGYIPTKKTAAGRALHKEWDALPKWSYEKLETLTGYQDIFHNCRMYRFNFFNYPDADFAGMVVPIFDEDSVKSDKSLIYKPIKGLKELTWSQYENKRKKRIAKPAGSKQPRSKKSIGKRSVPSAVLRSKRASALAV